MNKRVASIQNIDEDIYLKEMADRFNYPQMTIEIADQIETLQNRGATDEQIINALQTIGERGGSLFSRSDNTLFSATTSDLTTRADGFKIADDNEMVDVVTIPKKAIPDFKTKRELVTFIRNILGNERNITIKSTGDTILVSNAGINRAAVKSRNPEYNEVFGAVRGLLENAKYSGFVEAGEKHPNVRGQDVYHSALVIGTKPYAVQFKVDIPNNESSHNYAGHKISDIKIAPTANADGYFNSPMQNNDAISNVTLAVLRGKVNPARQKNGTLYSRGSTIKGLYNPTTRVAKLFKSQTPDTLMHELSHNFFANYFELTEQYGLSERNKAIYDMLGKQSSKEFGAAEWETITEEFMKYLRTSEAPNIAARNLFERAKDWVIETFYTLNKTETPSPEVKEFFDNLIRDDMRSADLTDLQMSPRALKDVLKSIKTGNEFGLKGVRRSDLTALRKATHAFTPRKAKTLAEIIKRDDMQIKVYTSI